MFREAKKLEEVLRAVETFKKTTALDDRLEQYIPADNFSNFALHLAAMHKASDISQSTLMSYFNQMYDLAFNAYSSMLSVNIFTSYPSIVFIIELLYSGAKLNGDCATILRSTGKINLRMAHFAIQQKISSINSRFLKVVANNETPML